MIPLNHTDDYKDGILRTNIFCLLGNPGSGRSSVLKTVLDDKEFTKKYNIVRFTYGTTRPITPDDIIGETYFFFNEKEFKGLDPNSIIESRSYDLMTNMRPVYYFTLKDHIKFNTNYIGRVSLLQYEELRKWAELTQLKHPTVQISLYPITIKCNLFERFDRLENKASTEMELYNICARMVSEKFEYDRVIHTSPEVLDATNIDTLILDNTRHDYRVVTELATETKSFMAKKIDMQGA